MIPRSLLLLLLALLAACGPQLAGPRTGTEGLPAGLEVQLTVEPGEVGPRDPFAVRLTVTNTTARPIEVVTAHGCLATPHVLRDGRRIPFRGSLWGCYAAITTHAFAPGEARSLTWEMRAELYAEHPGDVDGAPAPAGRYQVRAEFDTPVDPGPGRRPAVERALRVR